MTETERLKLRKPEGNDYYSVDDFNHNMDILEETAGVASFNGRSGTVVPQAGDYTADMVDAAPAFANFFASGRTTGTKYYLDEAGWYRVCGTKYYTSLFLHISHSYSSGTPADIYAIVTCGASNPQITIVSASGWHGGNHSVDDLRITRDSEGNYYVDLHYTLSVRNNAYVNVIASRPILADAPFERVDFLKVAGAPDGETVMCNADWQNPPMYLGVEYRTTERYLGKPVYVTARSFGLLPSAGTSSVDIFPDFAATNIVSVTGVTSGGINFPFDSTDGDFGNISLFLNTSGGCRITTTTAFWANRTATIVAKYTKD